MTSQLMVGIPSHSGSVVMDCAATLLVAQGVARDRGWGFSFVYHGGAVISVTRNAIAAEFLRSDADRLLMLDADQGISRVALERMLALDKPFVGGLYPMRYYDWSHVRRTGAPAGPTAIPDQALRYVGSLASDETGAVAITNGFARAHHVGTGALLVERQVFERVMRQFPELENIGFGRDLHPGLEPNWGFFNPMTRADGLPLSEDISFCRRWAEAGGEIWADVQSRFTHSGPHAFAGSYLESIATHEANQTAAPTLPA